jgi:hypothetical protein
MNKQLPRLILGLSILLPVLASALFLLVPVTGPGNSGFDQADARPASAPQLAADS